MKRTRVWLAAWCFALPGVAGGPAWAGAVRVDLGAAAGFAVLGGTGVANTGPSTFVGDIGVLSGAAPTGLPPDVATGTQHVGDAASMQAGQAVAAAWSAAGAETGATDLTGSDLGGMTLAPGVYFFASSAQLTGTLRLDAGAAPDAAFVFQIGSTLTTAQGAAVTLLDAAADAQVVWQVGSSATLGTGTQFVGDILALASITLDTGSSVRDGAVLAHDGSVTLDSASVSLPAAFATGAAAVPEPGSIALLMAVLTLALTSPRRSRGAPAA